MAMTTYTRQELTREARLAVKGKGKMLDWSLLLWQGSATLRVFYEPKIADEDPGVLTFDVAI